MPGDKRGMLSSAPRCVAAMPQCVIPMRTGGLPMADARIIKRYANRKLYDTQHSRYVTLDQISEMIRAGDDVKIVDNKTKEDLTTVTLAQIIFEEEKKQRSFLPLNAMRVTVARPPPARAGTTTRRWSRSGRSRRCASGSSTPSTGSTTGRSRS